MEYVTGPVPAGQAGKTSPRRVAHHHGGILRLLRDGRRHNPRQQRRRARGAAKLIGHNDHIIPCLIGGGRVDDQIGIIDTAADKRGQVLKYQAANNGAEPVAALLKEAVVPLTTVRPWGERVIVGFTPLITVNNAGVLVELPNWLVTMTV